MGDLFQGSLGRAFGRKSRQDLSREEGTPSPLTKSKRSQSADLKGTTV